MIYLDNAATTLEKPPAVSRAMCWAMRHAGGAGRSAHPPAMLGADIIYDTRRLAAQVFDVPDPTRVIFTANATQALNMALYAMAQTRRHFAISGNRQCPLGIQRPAQILLVPFPAAIARFDDIRREAYRCQRGQRTQSKHKRDEPAENPRLLFHGNSLFLLLSLVNTTWFYCTQEKSSSQQVCRKNGENR